VGRVEREKRRAGDREKKLVKTDLALRGGDVEF
jgi:hypothetical protein